MKTSIFNSIRLLAIATVLLLSQSTNAQLAFPGAEGFGANTPGGRGGAVIQVTNLNDSGPGSLRAACEASGPRIVVFRVSGTINLQSTIKVTSPYLTIAGQSAPGDGICLKSSGTTTMALKTHDIILRYLRIRPGPGGESDGLAIQTEEAHDIMIDHCSITWGVDESASIYTGNKDKKVKNVTYQWCIISDALDCSTHDEGCHSKGLLLQYCDKVSVHHTLFANNGGRNPMILSGEIDVVNNVVYNWGGSAVKIENRHGDVFMNYVKNYLIPGEDSDRSENGIQVKTPGIFMYLKDNIAEHVRPDNSYLEDAIVNYRATPEPLVTSRYNYPSVTTTSATQAYDDVLDNSGATLPKRDVADQQTVQGVRNRTGRIIDDPSEVGGYPVLNPTTPPTDTDADGMPDTWEADNGLDANDASDAVEDADGDGYTNVEEYLNGLVDEPAPVTDCNGDAGGSAYLDGCGDCVGGNTGAEPCAPLAETWQAEDATLSPSMEVTNIHSGYRGSGFVNFPKSDGSVLFSNVDGGAGGSASLTLRWALGSTAREGQLVVNGQAQTLTMEGTGAWTNWTTKTITINLNPGGGNTISIESTGNDFGNLDEISVEPASSVTEPLPGQQRPYGGTAHPITNGARIEAEHYDQGGPNTAYYDTDEGNRDCAGRTDQVDLQTTTDQGGGCNVGWIKAGEWLEYTVEVEEGTYDIKVRLASPNDNRTLGISLDGNVLGTVDCPNASSGWQDWRTATLAGVTLPAGEHVIRLTMQDDSFNINYLEFEKKGAAPNLRSAAAVQSKYIYPNPVNDKLYLPTTKDLRSVQIYGLNGQELRYVTTFREKYLDVEAMPEGSYILRLNWADHTSTNEKFLIKR